MNILSLLKLQKLWVCFFLIWNTFLFSQVSGKIKFQEISINKTLPSKFIKDLKKTKKFIWIATSNGITRWNIQNNKTSTFMKGTFVTSLAIEDNENSLWVGTPNGLYYLNAKNNKKTLYNKAKKQLSDNRVNCLYLSNNNVLYVGTFLGVDKFENNTWRNYTAFEGLAGTNIQDIASDGSTIWVAGGDGLSFYDVNDDFWFSYSYDRGLTSNQLTSLVIDGSYIWTGSTSSGLLRFNRIAERFDSYNNNIGAIDDTSQIQTVTNDGSHIWAGSFEGLLEADKNKYEFKVFQAQDGILEPSIQTTLVRGNMIYVGTDGQGIFVANKQRLEVDFLSDKTSYVKSKQIEIVGDIISNKKIRSVKVTYKAISQLQDKWLSRGIQPLKVKNSETSKIALLNLDGVPDDTYIIKIEALDFKGIRSIDTGRIIVDNTNPQVRLSFRNTTQSTTKEITIIGRYDELNLKNISVLEDGKPIIIQLNKQEKIFRFPYNIQKQATVKITLEDIGKNITTIVRQFSFDNDKPILKVDEISKKNINKNIIKITGTVEDENINQVLLFPGGIEAVLTPNPQNKNINNFEVNFNIKKEGGSQIVIQAIDTADNETTIKKKIDFFSDVSILELNTDLISKVSLKPFVEVSGFVLGPSFKRIYIKKENINIPLINKAFKKVVKLKLGNNNITIVAIDKEEQKIEKSISIEYINTKPSLKLSIDNKYFLEKDITLIGSYDKGVKSIYFNKKPLNLDTKNRSFQVQFSLKKGANILNLVSIDLENNTSTFTKTVYYDNERPKLSISPTPSSTSLLTLPIRVNIKDSSAVNLAIFPNIEIDEFNSDNNKIKSDISLQGNVHLNKGQNKIKIIATDSAGNKTEKVINITYDEKAPKTATGAAEVIFLKAEIERLKKLLEEKNTKGAISINSNSVNYKRRLPAQAGLFLSPLVGKIKSYSLASKIYLGNESFGDVIASFNGKNPQYMNEVLVPSSQLFNLLNRTRSSKLFAKVIAQFGRAYIVTRYKPDIEKKVLKYVTKTNNFFTIKNAGSHTLIKTKDNKGIIITYNLQSVPKYLINKYQLKEILVAAINSRSILFKIIKNN